MFNEIPLHLSRHLEEMGLLSREHEELDDPIHTPVREYKFRTPNFDENGEPDFWPVKYVRKSHDMFIGLKNGCVSSAH